MKRLKEEFVEKLESIVPLSGLTVLEVGCGEGTRTVALATKAKQVVAIDPSDESISIAKKQNQAANVSYSVALAEALPFQENQFDAAIFTLSLHHVPIDKMRTAISEAIRVVKPNAWIAFLEPGTDGSFFEAELLFNASDGDERSEKAAAYKVMRQHPGLTAIKEIDDETILSFDSLDDFVDTLQPDTSKLPQLQKFLGKHSFVLNAARRINIFRVKK